MDERRRVDPVLEEVRRLLPPDVAVVAVPAGETGREAPGDLDAAAEMQAVGALRTTWAQLVREDLAPSDIEVRWVHSTDGHRAWAEASTARPLTVTRVDLDDLDATVRALGDAGWNADRRDRGQVRRVLAQNATAGVEIQVRPTDGVVAVRARSTAVPVGEDGAAL